MSESACSAFASSKRNWAHDSSVNTPSLRNNTCSKLQNINYFINYFKNFLTLSTLHVIYGTLKKKVSEFYYKSVAEKSFWCYYYMIGKMVRYVFLFLGEGENTKYCRKMAWVWYVVNCKWDNWKTAISIIWYDICLLAFPATISQWYITTGLSHGPTWFAHDSNHHRHISPPNHFAASFSFPYTNCVPLHTIALWNQWEKYWLEFYVFICEQLQSKNKLVMYKLWLYTLNDLYKIINLNLIHIKFINFVWWTPPSLLPLFCQIPPPPPIMKVRLKLKKIDLFYSISPTLFLEQNLPQIFREYFCIVSFSYLFLFRCVMSELMLVLSFSYKYN